MSIAVEPNRLFKCVGASAVAFAVLITAMVAAPQAAHAQMPSVLYSWNTPGNVQDWSKAFGDNSATLQSTIAGELSIIETGTAGGSLAISDGGNRVRESSTTSNGHPPIKRSGSF